MYSTYYFHVTAAQFYSLSTLTSVELSVGLCRSYYKLPYLQQLV